MKIKEIPEETRPREKAARLGIEFLSDQELLALIIGSGVYGHSALDIASELLSTNFNSLSNLSESSLESLKSYKGLKENNALKLLAAFEFHKRLISSKYHKQEVICSAEQIYSRYKYLESYEQEVLIILMLDSKFRLKKEKTLYKGTYDSFMINVNEVLKELVLGNAKNFILIHNHPDGNKEPSKNDIVTTKTIEKSSKNLGLNLIDHLIIFKDGFYSFKKGNKINFN